VSRYFKFIFYNDDQIISAEYCRVDSRLRLHYFAAQHEQVADEFRPSGARVWDAAQR